VPSCRKCGFMILKHTLGQRLRAAGVSFEDRQDLLGHKSGRMTTHYSVAEPSNFIEAAGKACQVRSRKSPAVVALKRKAAGETISNRLISTEESARPAGFEPTTLVRRRKDEKAAR
jgi:hypothetical protein